MKREVVGNVLAFIDKASSLVGKMESEKFNQEMFCNCNDVGLESPIEDLFWIACQALCKAHYIEINPNPVFSKSGVEVLGYGLFVHPQAQVGKFRVDFLLSQSGIGPDEVLRKTIVELDGHDFHDKDKRQRSYEKSRDRFFVKEGYRVLHFTGSDVVADPFKVAFEALEMMGVISAS